VEPRVNPATPWVHGHDQASVGSLLVVCIKNSSTAMHRMPRHPSPSQLVPTLWLVRLASCADPDRLLISSDNVVYEDMYRHQFP
jgi:hypothetical protein